MELYRPSNSTDGDIFYREWCANCVREEPEKEIYCEILGLTLMLNVNDEGYPQEWRWVDGVPTCTGLVSKHPCTCNETQPEDDLQIKLL